MCYCRWVWFWLFEQQQNSEFAVRRGESSSMYRSRVRAENGKEWEREKWKKHESMCRSRVERMTLGKLCVSQTSRSWIDYRQQAAAAAWECLSHIRNESVVEIWYEMGWWRNMRIERASTAARRKKATEREPTTPITFFPNERSQISLLYTKGVKLSTIFLGVKNLCFD